MNDAELKSLIADCIAGSISREQHQALQETLRADPKARAAFRELVDVESSLRTWASEDASAISRTPAGRLSVVSDRLRGSRLRRPIYASLAVAASIAMIAVAGWLWLHRLDQPDNTAPVSRNGSARITAQLGTVLQLKDAVWSSPGGLTPGSRFPAGTLALASGVAQVELDSGTDIIMQGPCELQVLSVDSAQLLLGSVVVQVAELSDSFALNTPDAMIIDEGTEYAVSLDGEATEVHVFDGTVLWKPTNATAEQPGDRIEAGEARRYLRTKPMQATRIPLGMRQFVRKIEQSVQQGAGGALLAYDGFENLAGRLQRGRSGFGWSGGWVTNYQAHGSTGTIVDARNDTVFGMPRAGRRLLQLSSGESIWRDLEHPLVLEPGRVYYLSFIGQRHRAKNESGRFIQVSLCSDDRHPRPRSQKELGFGITTDRFPFVKNGGKITQSAPPTDDDTVYLYVGKIVMSSELLAQTYLRIYRAGEAVDQQEPMAWTTVGTPTACEAALPRVRLTVGESAIFDIDELRIGTTWHSVTGVTSATER